MLLNACHNKADALDKEVDVVGRLSVVVLGVGLHQFVFLIPIRFLDGKAQGGLETLATETPREPDGALPIFVGPIFQGKSCWHIDRYLPAKIVIFFLLRTNLRT